MENLNLKEVSEFVNENISYFHDKRLERLSAISLNEVLKKKNPYLFRAKNITLAGDLVKDILDAFLSSSEEKLFGDFLEELAIYISSKSCNGRKSVATGIDLEFENDDVLYLVSVKSGPNWGNNAQQNRQEADFQTAVRVAKQSRHTKNVQPVLGICYGKTRTSHLRGYMKVVGQNFWYLISGNENLYTDIVEPVGYRAKQHNDKFKKQKSKIVNLFTKEFLENFCKEDGEIDWRRLVVFNSGNLDLR
ncbi:MAG: PmeII family type II restriction endonuclease [Phycisphaerae bacterium]|jgi:hypothetical protein